MTVIQKGFGTTHKILTCSVVFFSVCNLAFVLCLGVICFLKCFDCV